MAGCANRLALIMEFFSESDSMNSCKALCRLCCIQRTEIANQAC